MLSGKSSSLTAPSWQRVLEQQQSS